MLPACCSCRFDYPARHHPSSSSPRRLDTQDRSRHPSPTTSPTIPLVPQLLRAVTTGRSDASRTLPTNPFLPVSTLVAATNQRVSSEPRSLASRPVATLPPHAHQQPPQTQFDYSRPSGASASPIDYSHHRLASTALREPRSTSLHHSTLRRCATILRRPAIPGSTRLRVPTRPGPTAFRLAAHASGLHPAPAAPSTIRACCARSSRQPHATNLVT